MQTIFVIDDEASITDAVQYGLEVEGFVVKVFHTGRAALTALAQQSPSLLILDVGLPDGSGFDFFRQYRTFCSAPVIFLTARNDEIDRIVGLEMGADDYIGKPFSVRELAARVRVVLRRDEVKQPALISAESDDAEFNINKDRKQIYYCGQLLVLTAHEYHLLVALICQPCRVLSRAQLLNQVWDAPEHRLERTVDTHIKGIRTKLRAINPENDPLKTHRGLGYSYNPSGK